jgi:DNA-binding transcriptional ArsR family regulator
MKDLTNLNDPSLVRALAHPLRAQILGILQERRASPRELSDDLGAPLGNVSYHVRILAELKLIKLVKKTPRRGAIEHHYEAVTAAQVSDETWSATPGIVKQAMVSSALSEVGRSASGSAAAGGFERTDAHLTRTRLTLDERGWKELGDALMRVLERAERIQEQSAERLKRADHQGEMDATMVMMLFETLPVGAPPAEAPARTQRRFRRDGQGRRAGTTKATR